MLPRASNTWRCVCSFACLFICDRNNAKYYGWIFLKFGEWVDYGLDKELIKFFKWFGTYSGDCNFTSRLWVLPPCNCRAVHRIEPMAITPMVDVDGSSSHLSADSQPKFGLRVGGHPALSLHSSNEPGELSQWPWSWGQHHKHCRWLLIIIINVRVRGCTGTVVNISVLHLRVSASHR